MLAHARPSLQRLLAPRSVAIAGVASAPGSMGGTVLENLERWGFGGSIHLVHPTRAEIGGRACVPGVLDLPPGIDCVVLAIPAVAVAEAVEGCAARGVGGVVIFAAGFAEGGEAGAALQARIAAAARSSGMAVLGPNCLGFVNDAAGVPLTFAPVQRRIPGGAGAAIVSQSGAMASAIRASLLARGLDLTVTVSTGNEAANGLEDFLEAALDEPRTKVVALIAEQIRDPRRFLTLAATAQAAGTAVVLLHSGRTNAARQAVETHTGALAGDFAVMRTIAGRHGVLVVDTVEELLDVTELLLRCRCRPFGGAAVLGESGAFRALTLDYAQAIGLVLPQPEGAAREALEALSPGFIGSGNPLDLTAQALRDPSLYDRAVRPLMENPRCGSLLVTIILTSDAMARRKMPPVIDLLRDWAGRRTTVFAMLGEDTAIPEEIVDAVRAAGVPFFRSPERALRAIARLAAGADAPPPWAPTAPGPRLHPGPVMEHAAKRLLHKAGVPCPPFRLVQTEGEAQDAAAALGWPVVLKVQSATLPHKSDVGGVVLGLDDARALREGWARLQANLAAHAPDASIDGVLVEPMASAGLELILGARRDPDWGPVVAIGLGGVAAEAFGDVRLLPADADPGTIRAALLALRGARLLGPFRGRPARDLDSVVAAVQCVGTFMRAHPEVGELDINPLLVFAEGQGVLALDALLTVN